MTDDNECFICLFGDEEVGKGGIISIKMTHCGCSPCVHSACLVEWYTGAGADGRDICPVCRTRGRIQGIAEIIQRVVLSGASSSSISLPATERYHVLPDTDNVPREQPQPAAPAQLAGDNLEEQRRNQQKVGVMLVILILMIMFGYALSNVG